jgi:hypothetical protein
MLAFSPPRNRPRCAGVWQVFRSFLTSIFWAAFVGCAIHAYKEAAIRRVGAFLSEYGPSEAAVPEQYLTRSPTRATRAESKRL